MKIIKRILVILILGIVVTGMYYWVRFTTHNQETSILNDQAREGTTGEYIKLRNGITHYQSEGPDTTEAIILVHGFSVPYYIWDATYDYLVQKGLRVVRYDLFGRGYSDRPDVNYDLQFYRTQLYDLINSLELKTPVNLAGLSFGGPVVTDFAVNYPGLVDRLILIDPIYFRSKLNKSEFVTNYEMALNHEKQASSQLDDVKYPDSFPGWVDKYKVQMKYKGFRHALISTRKYCYGDITVLNYKRLDSLEKKVLLIWGKEDQTVSFQFSDSVRKILSVDFFPVDDARHLPHLEKPELVNQKILSFLNEF